MDDADLPENVTPWFDRPEFTWKVTRELGGLVTVQSVNRYGGVGEYELWCTVDQAHELAGLLAAL